MATERQAVVVVGGGPAGAATAILLRRDGHQVTLLDRACFPRPKPCGESISPEAVPLLADLGALERLHDVPYGRHAGLTIYPYADAPFHGTYASRANGVAGRALGLSIPRTHLDKALLDAARAAGVSVREGWVVREVGPWMNALRMVLGQDAAGMPFALETPLLLAADGIHSTVARRLGLSRPSTRLRQIAIVTHMRGVLDLGDYGEMHVMPGGYCGVNPLGNGLANVAMVVPVSAGPGIAGQPTAFLRQQLASYPHLAARMREAEIVGGPWSTSGLCRGVRRRVDDGLLLVGDAGGYYDPFTGEGIYRGLRGAVLAAQVAGTALARGDTSAAALRPYAWRYRREFVPKRLVEIIVHEVTTRQPLFEHVAARLRRSPTLADTLMGVTGDFVSPYEVLSPWYVARLLA